MTLGTLCAIKNNDRRYSFIFKDGKICYKGKFYLCELPAKTPVRRIINNGYQLFIYV